MMATREDSNSTSKFSSKEEHINPCLTEDIDDKVTLNPQSSLKLLLTHHPRKKLRML